MPTLEQVFQSEKAWIAACDDPDALIEKIGDWRESQRLAARDGDQLVRMRAGDLIELARKRVVRLNEREFHMAEAAKGVVPPTVTRAEPPARPTNPPARPSLVGVGAPAKGPAPRREVDDDPARRKARDEAARATADKAKADARIAAAEAAKRELENELLRAQIASTKRAAAAPTPPTRASSAAPRTTGAGPGGALPTTNAHPRPTSPPTSPRPAATAAAAPPRAESPGRPASSPTRALPNEAILDGYNAADRAALKSVGRWPPPPLERRGPFWSPGDDWPGDWTLTGGELGRFRGEVNLTRAVLAKQLDVPSSAIKEAEMKPREKLGPAMQIAVRKAMDLERARRDEARRDRQARAEATASPAPSVEVLDGVGPPVGVALEPGVSTAAVFTGADLARLRTERGLTQKEAADLLGVEQGTISKGEAKGDAALGPALQEAMTRVAGARQVE